MIKPRFITPLCVCMCETPVLADDLVIPLCEMSPPQGRLANLRTAEFISAKRDCLVKRRNAVLVLLDRRRPSVDLRSQVARPTEDTKKSS